MAIYNKKMTSASSPVLVGFFHSALTVAIMSGANAIAFSYEITNIFTATFFYVLFFISVCISSLIFRRKVLKYDSSKKILKWTLIFMSIPIVYAAWICLAVLEQVAEAAFFLGLLPIYYFVSYFSFRKNDLSS